MLVYLFGLYLLSWMEKSSHTNNVKVVTVTAWMYNCIKSNPQKCLDMLYVIRFVKTSDCYLKGSYFHCQFGYVFIDPHVFFKWATLKLPFKIYLLYIAPHKSALFPLLLFQVNKISQKWVLPFVLISSGICILLALLKRLG